jgi:hypothetical protein
MNKKKPFRRYREEGPAVRRRRGRKRATGTRAPIELTRAGAWPSSPTHSAGAGVPESCASSMTSPGWPWRWSWTPRSVRRQPCQAPLGAWRPDARSGAAEPRGRPAAQLDQLHRPAATAGAGDQLSTLGLSQRSRDQRDEAFVIGPSQGRLLAREAPRLMTQGLFSRPSEGAQAASPLITPQWSVRLCEIRTSFVGERTYVPERTSLSVGFSGPPPMSGSSAQRERRWP